MEPTKMTSAEYFKTLKIVHFALMMGIAFFAAVSILIQNNGFVTLNQDTDNIFMIIVPIFALIGIIASNIVFKNSIKQIEKKPKLLDKLNDYRSATIVKLAIIEVPSFLSVVAFMLTANYVHLIVTGVLLFVFFIYSPTKKKFISELNLSKSEINILNNPTLEILD